MKIGDYQPERNRTAAVWFFIGAAVTGAFVLCGPSRAAYEADTKISCYSEEEFDKLMLGFGEKRVAGGLAGPSQDALMEIWANKETGSWTVTYTDVLKVDGKWTKRICSSGSGWRYREF